MNSDLLCIIFEVSLNCVVFAFFLFIPFKSRFRYSYLKTGILTLLLALITIFVTVFFFTPDVFFGNRYASLGILFWFISAVTIFHQAIKGSFFEILFIVLVILNLYVNISAIAKVLGGVIPINASFVAKFTLMATISLIIYIPFFWLLIGKSYKKIIEYNINFSFWKYIWIIPALNYLIFYIKILNDYWRNPVELGMIEVMFVILWSFLSYGIFYVIMEMLLQTYQRMTAIKEAQLMTFQVKIQGDQYERIFENIERTARLRHDWRHHLLSINSFVEKDNIKGLKKYLKELLPMYISEEEVQYCQNHVVNIILQYNALKAESNNIKMKIEMKINKHLSIPDTDLCIIFGNLVENATEACINQENSHRFIEIKADTKENQLVLMIKNTYNKKIKFKNGVYYSTKHEGVGIGLTSVKKIVEKNNGFMQIELSEKYFTIRILLNVV